eukprot:4917637-Lingulodinium_polyedra.AAC.1
MTESVDEQHVRQWHIVLRGDVISACWCIVQGSSAVVAGIAVLVQRCASACMVYPLTGLVLVASSGVAL